MSNASFPNPAQVCKQRGWGPGDEIRHRDGSAFLITYIGRDYIDGEWPGGTPDIFRKNVDITGWSKAEPPPVVTIRTAGHQGGAWVLVNDHVCFKASVTAGIGSTDMKAPEANRYIRIGAEAIKAAIEQDVAEEGRRIAIEAESGNAPEPATACEAEEEGPYSVKTNGRGSGTYRVVSESDHNGIHLSSSIDTDDKFGATAIDEMIHRHAIDIASELNRLHALKSTTAPGNVAGA